MKLLPLYSLSTGLKIGKQFLAEKFFPLSDDSPYITLHASSGMPSKNYPYFNEVFSILIPILSSNNIKVYQIGAKEDSPINGCIHLMGQTSLHQSNFLLKRALIHIGNDSWSQHRAGHIGVPVIDLFGPTAEANHSPYEHTQNSIFLESHRWGRNPSFSNQEPESTIALIPPEEVVNSVLKLLGATITLPRESLYIGPRYVQPSLEWIPDAVLDPNFAPNQPVLARLDLGGDENNLFQTLSARKLHIFTKIPINLNGLAQFRGNVELLIIEFTKNNLITKEFIKAVKSIGIKIQCISYELDSEELSNKRLEFFDYCQINKVTHKTREDFIYAAKRYQNLKEWAFTPTQSTWFRSNKFLLARGKIYLSKFHYLADLPTQDFGKNVSQMVDHEDFWREQEYFYVFNQELKT